MCTGPPCLWWCEHFARFRRDGDHLLRPGGTFDWAAGMTNFINIDDIDDT